MSWSDTQPTINSLKPVYQAIHQMGVAVHRNKGLYLYEDDADVSHKDMKTSSREIFLAETSCILVVGIRPWRSMPALLPHAKRQITTRACVLVCTRLAGEEVNNIAGESW